MKTPNRNLNYSSDPNADLSYIYELEPKMRARWKRKNREAQLKHTIARLYKERDAYKLIFREEVNKCIGFIKLYSEAKRELNELKERLKKEKSRGDALLEQYVEANKRVIFLETRLP